MAKAWMSKCLSWLPSSFIPSCSRAQTSQSLTHPPQSLRLYGPFSVPSTAQVASIEPERFLAEPRVVRPWPFVMPSEPMAGDTVGAADTAGAAATICSWVFSEKGICKARLWNPATHFCISIFKSDFRSHFAAVKRLQ